MSNTHLTICDYLFLLGCRMINDACRQISLSSSRRPLNLNLLSWLVNLLVAHLEAEELIRRRRNWPQYSDRRWMDLDDAIPVCHNVYGEPPNVSV